MVHPFFDVPRPTVIGHRGAAGDVPENTLLSFDRAIEGGAQILESDIHLTRDGVPILLHDPDLDRVCDGRGPAADYDLSELQALDAGFSFKDEEGQTPFRGRGLQIPTLAEAFERFPDARFNLEIKCAGADVIRATLDLIERFDRSGRTLIAAGDDAIMQAVRHTLEIHPAAPAMGASLGEIIGSVSCALENKPMPSGVMALQIPPDFAGQPLVTPALVDHAHAHGVAVHVWTINELAEIEALLELGVDGIITDHPGRMAAWLARPS